jgi:hypothetical protein
MISKAQWAEVAERDLKLRNSAERAGEALGRYRYEHTIAVGVSFSDYAKHCGVLTAAVSTTANAWKVFSQRKDPGVTYAECFVRANSTEERADVVESVAKARGLSPRTVHEHHGREVRDIQEAAKERAERRGTTVKEEATKLADTKERIRKNQAEQRQASRNSKTQAYLDIDRPFSNAHAYLVDTLNAARDAELDGQSKEFLSHTSAKCRALLDLIDMAINGKVSVDWDAEMRKLEAS